MEIHTATSVTTSLILTNAEKRQFLKASEVIMLHNINAPRPKDRRPSLHNILNELPYVKLYATDIREGKYIINIKWYGGDSYVEREQEIVQTVQSYLNTE